MPPRSHRLLLIGALCNALIYGLSVAVIGATETLIARAFPLALRRAFAPSPNKAADGIGGPPLIVLAARGESRLSSVDN